MSSDSFPVSTQQDGGTQCSLSLPFVDQCAQPENPASSDQDMSGDGIGGSLSCLRLVNDSEMSLDDCYGATKSTSSKSIDGCDRIINCLTVINA